MVKLERIVVHNYKNIDEADLQLGNLNVIVGENNAGKTTFLESLSFINNFINGPVDEIEMGMEMGGYFRKYINVINVRNNEFPTIAFNISFSENELIFNYNLKLDKNGKKNSLTGNDSIGIAQETLTFKEKSNTGKPKIIFNREGTNVKYGDEIKKGEVISVLEDHVSTIRLLNLIFSSKNIHDDYKLAIVAFNEIIKTPTFYFSNHLLKLKEIKFENSTRIARFDLNEEISKIMKGDNKELFLKNIKQILNADDVRVREIDDKPSVSLRLYGKYTQIFRLSDGSVILLAFIVKLFSDKSNVFFIEEPENSIHPRALYELMRLLSAHSLDKQFVITTHSPYLLNMIKPENVFVASIGETGMSKIEKLPNVREIKRKLSKGFMNFGDIVFSQSDTDEDEE